ncbi:MAG: divalent-cation tolerance protein CutA [Luteolibacter sp.]
MSDVLLILCTFPLAEQARQIGTALVERQLAACVNLVPAVESIYRWEGKVETASEVLAIFKTTRAAYPAFEQALTRLHPYEVPEIIAISPDEIAAPYRKWILAQTADGELMRNSIFPLWAALGHARAVSGDIGPPWESIDPSVIQAWADLTAPQNLGFLAAWLDAPQEMNPVAEEAAIKAVEVSRERASLSKESGEIG